MEIVLIVIFDPLERRESAVLRENIRRTMLPCALSAETPREENFFVCVYAADCVNSKLLSNTVDPEKLTPFFINELSVDGDSKRETDRVINRLYDILYVKYGINPESYYAERFIDTFSGTRYANRRIHLTDSERLIARYLTSFNGKWKTAEEIVSFCFERRASPVAVAVHITKINAKASESSNVTFIETKRNIGYRYKKRGANS